MRDEEGSKMIFTEDLVANADIAEMENTGEITNWGEGGQEEAINLSAS